MPVLQRPDSAARRLQQCRQGLSASLTEMRHELEALERQAPPLKPSRAASANATTPTTPSSALIRRNSLEPVGKLESSNNITAWDKERPPQLPPVQRGGDPTPVESPKEAPVVTKVETDRVNSLESNRLMEEQCHGTVRSMEQELPALCALSAQLARVVGKECSNTGLLLMEHYDLCEWMRPVPNYVAVPRLISSMGMAISRELLWDLQATLPPHPPPQSKLDEAARAMKQIFSNKRDTRGAESKKARLLTSLKPFEAMMAQADLAGDGHGDAASGTASGLVKTPPQLPGHVVQLSALIGSDPVSRMTTELVASNSQLRTFTSVSAKLTRRLKKLHERGEHDKASELSTEIGELYDGAMELHKRRLNDGVMYAQTETDMLRAQVDEWAAAAVPQVGAFMDYHERLTKVCQGDLPLVADRMNEEKQNTKRINEALLHDTRSIQSSLDANATDLDKCCMQLDDLLTNAQTLLDKRRKLTKQHIAAVEKARLETATITKSLEVCQRHADSIKQVKQHSSKCLALGAVCSTIINQGYDNYLLPMRPFKGYFILYLNKPYLTGLQS